MAEILRDVPDRTAQQVANDLERLLAGIGDDAPLVVVVMSVLDLQLIRGLAGKPGVMLFRDYPAITKALKMQVRVEQDYKGPPRIVRTIGNLAFDAHADKAKRDDLRKKNQWLEANVRLRQGINGTPLG